MVANTTALFLFWWLDERRIDFKLFFLISDFFLSATCIIFWMILVSLLLSLVQRHHGQCESHLYSKQPPNGFSAVAQGLCPFSGYIQWALSCPSIHSYPRCGSTVGSCISSPIVHHLSLSRNGQHFHWLVREHLAALINTVSTSTSTLTLTLTLTLTITLTLTLMLTLVLTLMLTLMFRIMLTIMLTLVLTFTLTLRLTIIILFCSLSCFLTLAVTIFHTYSLSLFLFYLLQLVLLLMLLEYVFRYLYFDCYYVTVYPLCNNYLIE